MNIKLRCPDCQKELVVACATGLEVKSAPCPHCKNGHLISEYLPQYSLNVEGKNYQLKLGRQWIGRMHPKSEADVQMPDPTNYMSRKHAIVELKCTNAGVRCTFEEHGTNPTQLLGIKLIEDDIVYINVNDCLQLGSRKMYLTNEFGE